MKQKTFLGVSLEAAKPRQGRGRGNMGRELICKTFLPFPGTVLSGVLGLLPAHPHALLSCCEPGQSRALNSCQVAVGGGERGPTQCLGPSIGRWRSRRIGAVSGGFRTQGLGFPVLWIYNLTGKRSSPTRRYHRTVVEIDRVFVTEGHFICIFYKTDHCAGKLATQCGYRLQIL